MCPGLLRRNQRCRNLLSSGCFFPPQRSAQGSDIVAKRYNALSKTYAEFCKKLQTSLYSAYLRILKVAMNPSLRAGLTAVERCEWAPNATAAPLPGATGLAESTQTTERTGQRWSSTRYNRRQVHHTTGSEASSDHTSLCFLHLIPNRPPHPSTAWRPPIANSALLS